MTDGRHIGKIIIAITFVAVRVRDTFIKFGVQVGVGPCSFGVRDSAKYCNIYDKIQDGRWWPYWKLTRKHG